MHKSCKSCNLFIRDLELHYINSTKLDLPKSLGLYEALRHGRLTVRESVEMDDVDVR